MKNYDKWEDGVSISIKGDLIWKMQVYRLSLFASDIGWYDVTKLQKDRRTVKLSDQLYRALGSISANIAEGFSRSSRKDQNRFWEYALGSARSKAGIGISKVGTCWVKLYVNIGCSLSQKSSVYC